MPFAANGVISQEPMDGGIEITNEQYAEALAGMLAGNLVTIDKGFRVESAPKPETLDNALPASDWPTLIAAKRFSVETTGIAWNGYWIATDRESRALIDQELAAIARGRRIDWDGWKCLNLSTQEIVFRPTSNAELGQIGDRVYDFVRDCFRREAELLAMGDAVTESDLAEGWPSNGVGA